MTENFPTGVQSIVGPLLAHLGFVLDGIDNDVDEGGRRNSVVYYRSNDCKIQIYQSSREGSVNCMIAPLDAPNKFGPRDRSYKWQYLTRFSLEPNVPLEELVQSVSFEAETDTEQLDWVRDRIVKYFDVAHAGILQMYGTT
jgi:hypothetical protein